MEKLRNLNKEQKIGLAVVTLLGLALIAGLVAFYTCLYEASKDSEWIDLGHDVIVITPTPKPTNSSTTVYLEDYTVTGDLDFSYSGSLLIQKEYVVVNNLDVPLSFKVKATCTDGTVNNLSWDKTSAVVEAYGSVVFKLSLLPSEDGVCVINIYKT